MQNPAATIMQTHPVKHWAHLKPKFLLGDRTCSSIPKHPAKARDIPGMMKVAHKLLCLDLIGFQLSTSFQQIVQMFSNVYLKLWVTCVMRQKTHEKLGRELLWSFSTRAYQQHWDPVFKTSMSSTHCVFFVESIEVMLHWGNHFETFHYTWFSHLRCFQLMFLPFVQLHNWLPPCSIECRAGQNLAAYQMCSMDMVWHDLAFWHDPLLLQAQSSPKNPHARDGHEVQDRSLLDGWWIYSTVYV